MQTAARNSTLSRSPPRRAIRFRFALAALTVLVLAQLLSGVLTVSAIRKTAFDGTVTAVRIVGHDWSFRIQNSLRFGKPISQMFGLPEILAGIRSDLSFLTGVVVTLPDGSIVESNSPDGLLRGLGALVAERLAAEPSTGSNRALAPATLDGTHVFVLPVSGAGGRLAGALVMLVPAEAIAQQTAKPVADAIIALAMATLLGAIAVVLASLVVPIGADGTVGRWKLLAIPALILVLVQGGSSWRNIVTFRDAYVQAATQNVQRSVDRFGTDLQGLVAKGVKLDRLSDYAAPFARLAADIPELASLRLDGPSGRSIAAFDATGEPPTNRAPITYQILSADGASLAARLSASLSDMAIGQGVRRRALDAGTVLLTSALFGFELLVLFGILMRRLSVHGGEGTTVDRDGHHLLARPASFLLVFAWALPLSFVPLQMGVLTSEPLFGLSRAMTLALPISAEMGCALVTALIAGILTDRRGWHLPFVLGGLVCAAGALAGTLAIGPMTYILSRAVVGLGYGLAWMGIQGYVFSWSSPRTRTQAVANLVAGIFAGQICGNVTGAMLADQIGFSSVFAVAAILGLAPILFAFGFMRIYFGRPLPAPEQAAEAPVPVPLAPPSGSALGDLFKDRNFVALLLLSVVPFSIAQVGLLFYTLPVYLSQQGIEQGNIGRIMMIYGLSVIYIAPLLGRWVDRHARKTPFIVMGGLLGGLGLAFTYLDVGLAALVASVFFLGLASSLGGPAQTSFALRLPSVQRLGTGRAMGIQRAADKLGQMVGPLALGGLFTFLGTSDGLAVVGGYYLGSTLLFFLIARDPRQPLMQKGASSNA
ncbi:MFS transporter [Aureimonas pseudogalii]|uniref:Putative MFS family arabinose efflux permease n=1 Tax=Aureimonas pseudogalii TaxID=1744844 RepID=A0A7W6H8E8_9HYPH|nr:MFS transporter [Aureimonas pseudogalii]MBB4000447.1 putative MFS family arabinose efflux permease [Aureimonas pseudogalii]